MVSGAEVDTDITVSIEFSVYGDGGSVVHVLTITPKLRRPMDTFDDDANASIPESLCWRDRRGSYDEGSGDDTNVGVEAIVAPLRGR